MNNNNDDKEKKSAFQKWLDDLRSSDTYIFTSIMVGLGLALLSIYYFITGILDILF